MKATNSLVVGLTLLVSVRILGSSTLQDGKKIEEVRRVFSNKGITLANRPEALKGLKSILISVEDIGKDAAKDGLTKETVQTDVALKLRQAGIRVITSGEIVRHFQKYREQPNYAGLEIYIKVKKREDTPIYAFSTSVELQEDVFLRRSPQMEVIGAITWSNDDVGTVGASNLREVRDNVKDLVDKFCNDYLTTNPKK